jgi:NTE family protein
MTDGNPSPRLGLVIGSGSVKCAAALGLWKVLEREGIQLDMVVGCSGGSIFATGIAFGDEVSAIEQSTIALWTEDVLAGYTSNLKAAMTGAVRFTERSGLVDIAAAEARITSVYGERTFEQARIPLSIVATDFMSGEPVVLAKGRVMDAIRASIAIPMVFPPHELDGRLLIDGAVANPLPLDVAIKEGCRIILAMGFELPYRTHMRSFNAVQAHLNAIYINNILRATYSFFNLAHHAEIIPILPAFDRDFGNFETAQLPYIIECGEKEAETQVGYLKKLLRAADNHK